MNHPTILAFMQNPWFPVGTARTHIDRYLTDQEFHRRVLAGSMSGGRLKDAFGPDMFNRIWWDNVAPEAATFAAGQMEIDFDHVERVIERVKPDLILTFGNLAERAIVSSIQAADMLYMPCHHPNARHRTSADLADFAIRVASWVDEWRVTT